MATPHINAEKGQIAKTVFMAGDPLRAKYFAENFLDEYTLISDVRNIYVYTGKVNSKEVTIMAHGMGLNSIGIYAFELYSFFDVERIIRFGSAGSYSSDVKLLDIVIADKAYTDSNYGEGFGYYENIISATPSLVKEAQEASKRITTTHNILTGTVNASPWFYQTDNLKSPSEMYENNILCVEMEAFALYAIAAKLNKEALTILTISDNLATGEELSSSDRQVKFKDMFDIIIELIEVICD